MMFHLDDNEMRLLLRFYFKYYIGSAHNKSPRDSTTLGDWL